MGLDDYEIVKELGRGGMGAVFLANDKRLKRQVAIKVLKLPPTLDTISKITTINNFKREAVAIANLAHNNIVCVYDIGNKDDMHYIVMELIEGHPLSKILKVQNQPFHIDTVLKIADEICDSLSYVHKNRVIHRDIKPENIIYTSKGISKLTDFGIAKFKGDESMEVKGQGDVKGTILYISPEQLQFPDAVDGRADMYSFSVSLYELLTGRLPFEGESPREVIMKILTEEPIPPSKLAPDLIPHIDQVILKAMQKEPDKRYANIDEFRDELKNVGDFLSRSSIQGFKGSTKKEDNFTYGQVSLDSFEDLLTQVKVLPEQGQQRLLYEIEMLLSKYLFEYKDQLEVKKEPVPSVDRTNYETPSISAPQPPKTIISPFSEGLMYVIPQITVEGKNLTNPKLSFASVPMDLSMLLSRIDGKKTIKQIIDTYYFNEKPHVLFNLLNTAHQRNLLTFDSCGKVSRPILVGDILTSLGIITQFQLEGCLKAKEREKMSPNSKMLGEILVDAGFLTRDKLLSALKIQHWYRKVLT